jgi:hypothetical protein
MHPGPLYEVGLAHRTHDDVGLLHDRRQFRGLGMADGHGRIGCQEHHGHRLPEYRAPADYNGMFAFNIKP